jgi:hypothetical protein
MLRLVELIGPYCLKKALALQECARVERLLREIPTFSCCSTILSLKCSESGPLFGPACLPSWSVVLPVPVSALVLCHCTTSSRPLSQNPTPSKSNNTNYSRELMVYSVPSRLAAAGVCVGDPPPAEKRSSMFCTPCVLYGFGNQYWRMYR